MENISLNQNDQDISLNDVISASKLSEIHSFIETLPRNYKTRVGERGSMLSGGQRQRISLARAIYNGRDIMFLDEATSAIDKGTELKIVKNLIGLNITIIAITHNRSILPYFDRIILFSNGKIIGDGNYKELKTKHPTLLK